MLALIGLILAVVDWKHLGVSGDHVRTALGESLIVAAALGVTVDAFYKRALARDAFEASLGYLLPEELKGELRWIYGQQIICIAHEMRVTIEPLSGDDDDPRRYRVAFDVWRTMRNVSNERVAHPTFSSVEEWFRGEPSGVEPIEWTRGGRHHSGGTITVRDVKGDAERDREETMPLQPSQLDERRPGVERSLSEPIVLDPGEEVTFRYRGHEVHHESGAFHEVFGAPTCRPVVHVEAPPQLRAEVWFANRGRSEVEQMGSRYTLPTVLLPFQAIVVRWWPRDRYDEWLAEQGSAAAPVTG